jgi:hypothetical protein
MSPDRTVNRGERNAVRTGGEENGGKWRERRLEEGKDGAAKAGGGFVSFTRGGEWRGFEWGKYVWNWDLREDGYGKWKEESGRGDRDGKAGR